MEWTTDHRQWYRNVYLKSEHWHQLKSSKLRASPFCGRCGTRKHLDIHHRNYRNIFDVTIDDLETLCRKCHTKEHDENEIPRRRKIRYERYFPEPAIAAMAHQKANSLPEFDFTTDAGRIAYSIHIGKTKWRKSDLTKYGIQKPFEAGVVCARSSSLGSMVTK